MKIDISVVTPAFNEEGNIDELCAELESILERMGLSYEIIIVDDCSTDGTWKKVVDNSLRNSQIIGVRHLRNSGQLHSIETGIKLSNGDFVLTIDSDLQHPVAQIPALWEKRNSTGIVVGQQVKRSESKIKSHFSSLFYSAIKNISGIDVMPNVGDFRLLKRQIALDLMSKKEEKILRFLIPKYGYLVETVTFEANRRVAGETKYSFSKMVGLGVTSIVSITTRPLYFSVFFAIAFAIISFIDFVYVVFSWFFYQTTPGWASIVGIISIGLTMIFAVLGIFGIYLAQIVRMLTSNDSTKFSITTRDQNHK